MTAREPHPNASEAMLWRCSFSVLLAAVVACSAPEPEAEQPPPVQDAVGEIGSAADTVTPARVAPASSVEVGQSVYVPVYSHIPYRDERRVINLTATLSIRNTDARQPFTLRAVRYYDSDGQLVRNYIAEPRVLAPMASTDFVIEEDDTSGGSGANFIVEWTAAGPVTEPVIEAVMISTASTLGISFISVGRPLERR